MAWHSILFSWKTFMIMTSVDSTYDHDVLTDESVQKKERVEHGGGRSVTVPF